MRLLALQTNQVMDDIWNGLWKVMDDESIPQTRRNYVALLWLNASQLSDRAGARKAFRKKATAAAKQSLSLAEAHNTRQRQLLSRLLARLTPAAGNETGKE
jgi:adenine-specific DNA methylase